MNNLEKWVWLSEALYKGSRKANELLSHFGDIEKIYTADRAALKGCGISFGEKELAKLLDKSLDASAKILYDCEKNGIRVILRTSEEFPKRLSEIADCPVLLYAKGSPLSVDEEPVISVVGTRKASVHGISAAKKISSEIAASGGVICSGLARGIDTVAMESALAVNGKVLGVLGCGVDIAYPSENRNLMKQVEISGTLLSEHPPKTPPDRINFPKRNRIVSALSLGVCVIEAPEKSGALITAQIALDQNRDVFAVPSCIFEATGRGTNNLIRMGATPITCGQDVLSEYMHLFGDKISLSSPVTETSATVIPETKEFSLPDELLSSVSPDERAILTALSADELRADEVSSRCNMPIPKVLSLLTMLEIRKIVKQLPGCRFKISY